MLSSGSRQSNYLLCLCFWVGFEFFCHPSILVAPSGTSCVPVPPPPHCRECICLLCLYRRVLSYSREALKVGLRGGTGNHQNLPPEFSHGSFMMPCVGTGVTSTWPTKASAPCCPDAGVVCPCTQFWVYNVYIKPQNHS